MNIASGFSWRPHTTVILVLGVVFISVAIVVSYITFNFRPTAEVQLGSTVLRLWVADDETERVQGLSGVESLRADGGLLMDFRADDKWAIWMKDMLLPLDIVWLNSSKEVIYIVKNAQPELGTGTVMRPKSAARYVIELPAGTVDDAGIKTGQVASFEVEEPNK